MLFRHQPQHLHSCATVVSGRRIGGRAARQATTAISPSLDWWTGRPSDRHRLQFALPRATTIGPFACWPEKPSNWALSSPSRRKPFASCSKKRTQALATRAVVHPSRRSRVCRGRWRMCWTSTKRSTIHAIQAVCFDEKLVAPEADVRPPEPHGARTARARRLRV